MENILRIENLIKQKHANMGFEDRLLYLTLNEKNLENMVELGIFFRRILCRSRSWDDEKYYNKEKTGVAQDLLIDFIQGGNEYESIEKDYLNIVTILTDFTILR